MEFKIHEIGYRNFIMTGDKVFSYRKFNETKEELVKNLEENLESLREEYPNEEKAIQRFEEIVSAKHQPDWIGYQYDGDFITLLEEDGFAATLPIKYTDGRYMRMSIVLYREEKNRWTYSVMVDGRPEGSIVRNDKENPKEFFERFIADVCYYNAVEAEGEVSNRYFPFSSRNMKENYEFYPALVLMDLSHGESLNGSILSIINEK